MVTAPPKKKVVSVVDLTKIDVRKASFTRYSDQVSIRCEDTHGHQMEILLGSDAVALIRQAGHNLSKG